MVNINKQHGIVLVAAMLMILMVSGIAISVMSGSAMDSKMVNATQDSYRAESITRGDTEQAIQEEIERKEVSKFIIKRSAYGDGPIILNYSGDSRVELTNVNTNPMMDVLNCPPRFAPTPGIKCNYLKLTTSTKYGKNNKNTMVIKTGIEQEMMGDL